MNKFFFLILSLALLLPTFGCSSCSSENNEIEPIKPEPAPEELTKGNEMVIYQVNPKLFTSGKAFVEIQQRLSTIKSLGANVLYIMPVYPQGQKNSVGSPYCIKDYTAVWDAYGTLDELKALVKATQQQGMLFMLDWVANHTAWDHPWVTEHPDWYTQKNGQVSSPLEQNWPDVADLNYNNKDLRAAMVDAMKYWVRELGIDGYRCDYCDGVPTDFWQDAISQLRELKGGKFVMLGESGTLSQYKTFDIIFSWDYPNKLTDLYAGKAKLEDLYKVSEKEISAGEGKLPCRFITNHDRCNDASPISLFKGEQGALSAYVLSIFQGGVPFIYSSQEIAYPSAINIFKTYSVDWSKNPGYVQKYQQIMKAYAASAEARGGKLEATDNNGAARLVWTNGERETIVLVNPTPNTIKAKLPMTQVGENYTEMIGGKQLALPSVTEVEGYSYLIYVK